MPVELKKYKGKKALAVRGEIIFNGIKDIIESGNSEEFLALCKEKNLSVNLKADQVNILKNYFFDKSLFQRSPSSKTVVSSGPCQPDDA